MSAETCSYEFWLGPRELKYSSSAVERSVKRTPRSAARAVLDTIGVTKVADVTDLDRVGIPNFMTLRPHDRGPGISYYNGKGTTRADAYAGAMMEAIERHAGERNDGPVIDASHYNLRRQHACVDPLEIHISMVRNYSEHLLLEWVLGFDLLTRRPTYAPLNCVVSPYITFSGMPVLFEYQRSRIAQYPGRSLCHALCEVVERDASALAMASSHRPAVAAILSDIGFGGGYRALRGAADLVSRIAPSPQRESRLRGRSASGKFGDPDDRSLYSLLACAEATLPRSR